MSVRVLRRALATRAAIAATSLLAVGGALGIGASAATATAITPVPVAGNLTLTNSAIAGGVNDPVALSFQLATPSPTTLVDPDKLYITLPSSFSLNTTTALRYGTKVFGKPVSGGGTAGSPASSAKPIATVKIVSAALLGTLGTSTVNGKLYLVTGVTTGYLGSYGLEISVSIAGTGIDFVGPLVQDTSVKPSVSTVQFQDLTVPANLMGGTAQPLPWSSFAVTMPSKTSVGTATTCGAAGKLVASLEDYHGSSMTAFKNNVSVICPATLSGKLKKAKSGKPMLLMTAKAHGAKFKTLTFVLPKALKLKKALKKDIKVKGAKLKGAKKVHGNLKVTFKSPVNRAHLTVKNVLRLNKKLVHKLKKHKKISFKIKLKSEYGTSVLKLKAG